MIFLQRLKQATAATIGVLLMIGEAAALDCRSLEQKNYLPTPQQPGARQAQDTPNKVFCGASEVASLKVGDYCVRHLQTGEVVLARVFALGTETIAVRALLSVEAQPFVVTVDIDSSYVGRKRYFGEARDGEGRNLMARRVMHPFPQEDDVDVPPPCTNSSFVRVWINSGVLRSRRKLGYSFVVVDDKDHKLRVNLSPKIIDTVLKTAERKWAGSEALTQRADRSSEFFESVRSQATPNEFILSEAGSIF